MMQLKVQWWNNDIKKLLRMKLDAIEYTLEQLESLLVRGI